MYCIKCGNELQKGNTFCVYCGTKLSSLQIEKLHNLNSQSHDHTADNQNNSLPKNSAVPNNMNSDGVTSKPNNSKQKKKKKIIVIVIVAGVVILLSIIAILLFTVGPLASEDTKEENPVATNSENQKPSNDNGTKTQDNATDDSDSLNDIPSILYPSSDKGQKYVRSSLDTSSKDNIIFTIPANLPGSAPFVLKTILRNNNSSDGYSWYNVELPNGMEGWIREDLVAEEYLQIKETSIKSNSEISFKDSSARINIRTTPDASNEDNIDATIDAGDVFYLYYLDDFSLDDSGYYWYYAEIDSEEGLFFGWLREDLLNIF